MTYRSSAPREGQSWSGLHSGKDVGDLGEAVEGRGIGDSEISEHMEGGGGKEPESRRSRMRLGKQATQSH